VAVVNTTIGTDARDYATHTLWESDDGGGDGLGNDDCTGSAYNDSAFDEAWTIDFDANSIVQTVAGGERHDGTAGSGARILATTSRTILISGANDITVTWLEIDENSTTNMNSDGAVGLNNEGDVTASHLIIHDTSGSGTKDGILLDGMASGDTVAIINNLIYDIAKSTGTGSAWVGGISEDIASLTDKTVYINNNTIHNTTNSGVGTGPCEGVHVTTGASELNIKNNIVTDTNGDTSGAIDDFDIAIADDVTNVSNNLSSDTTAPGANSLTAKSSANQFVSTSPVNLHLKSGADTFEAGTDLGTTPTGVNLDIDGFDRNAGATTWSMGAHDGDNLRGAAANNPWYHYAQQA